MRSRTAAYFQTEKARIEVIPMIDIMMFLLVFFIMITINAIVGSGIALELPKSKTPQPLRDTTITVGVKKEGALYVNSKALSPDEFTARLREAKEKGGKVEVVIAGDREVPLQKLLDVMDLVRAEDINSVGIAASKNPETAGAAAPAQKPR
ncbi:MAG: ExbD/TolR family protein [Betaproteobacteria bacterium]|jgi:biopolymer transport protein ExbD|nr:biopolymer transporter ExbD [Rhodocyclaceae bacterium]MCA3136042.1 biopolymer transporter ExbD [Rhodocyclaceae bacterium]MCA3141016.1 biopolymer transporter ExbD [Rhodocyclaceae bacterium]MCA3146188.1 biopolymer transporter ExbD [Rhodocyclaceae bacterium]